MQEKNHSIWQNRAYFDHKSTLITRSHVFETNLIENHIKLRCYENTCSSNRVMSDETHSTGF